MEGLDIAFYKGRARYHTKYDSPAFTSGGEKSLWSMIDVARGVGIGLLSEEPSQKTPKRPRPGVYFDMFKSTMVSFHLGSLLTFNVVALVVGPIVLVLFWLIASVIEELTPPTLPPKPTATDSASRIATRAFGAGSTAAQAATGGFWAKILPEKLWWTIWKQASFWVALLFTAVAQALLIWGHVSLNPFVSPLVLPFRILANHDTPQTVHTHPYLVLLSSFCLAYITITTTLFFAFPPSPIKHATIVREREKTTLFMHLHFLAWIILLISTIAIARAKVGGLYFITAWYVGVWGAGLVGCSQSFAGFSEVLRKRKKAVRRARSASSSSSSSSSSDSEDERRDRRDRASERTPLLGLFRQTRNDGTSASGSSSNGLAAAVAKAKREYEEGGAIGWWIVQVLLSVPVFVVLVGQLALLLLDAMNQSLTDGGSVHPGVSHSSFPTEYSI